MEYKSKTVEIIGPPGIGKSTLHRAVCKTWNPNSNWIYEDILLAPDRPSILSPFKWFEYNYRLYRGKNLKRNVSANFGLKFIKENEQLANFCWKYFSENPTHNSLGNRFRYAYFMYMDFCGYQEIAEKRNPKPCLVEEGFFQKSFLIHDNKQIMEEILDEYLSLLPLPYAIIGLDTEHTEIILKRIKERKKIIPSHYKKDEAALLKEIENWQYLLQLILAKLKNKNVLVFKIDGDKTIDEKVAILKPILKSLTP